MGICTCETNQLDEALELALGLHDTGLEKKILEKIAQKCNLDKKWKERALHMYFNLHPGLGATTEMMKT